MTGASARSVDVYYYVYYYVYYNVYVYVLRRRKTGEARKKEMSKPRSSRGE